MSIERGGYRHPETNSPTPEQEKTPEFKPLRRGLWSERLETGQELPVGGSLFSEELTTKLLLDFDSFKDRTERFTADNLKALFEQNKEALLEWLKKIDTEIDPYLFFASVHVQKKMHELLEVDPEAPDKVSFGRERAYVEGMPRLSSLRGKTACAERAALGQHLLQKIGLESAFVTGITMADVKDHDEYPEPHSFLVVRDPSDPSTNFIFDIARPKTQFSLPRLLKPDAHFSYDLLKDKNELLVRARDVLRGSDYWFGVGAPVAGEHEVVEVEKQE